MDEYYIQYNDCHDESRGGGGHPFWLQNVTSTVSMLRVQALGSKAPTRAHSCTLPDPRSHPSGSSPRESIIIKK